ncbi:12732_t:CDS:2 [Funneliformis geosporum]|nr:12732_t:CDS:2 [Funneliformis geosporum]
MSDSSLGGRALTYCEMEKLVYPIHGHIVKLPESPKAFGYRGGRENGLAADGRKAIGWISKEGMDNRQPSALGSLFLLEQPVRAVHRLNGDGGSFIVNAEVWSEGSLAAPTDYLPSGYLPRMEMYLDVGKPS